MTSEEATESLSRRIQALEQQMRALRDEIDDLKNRGRRMHLRIVGLAEGEEVIIGVDMEQGMGGVLILTLSSFVDLRIIFLFTYFF
ncbi:hypothetical protein chiPu_0006397 [Chiloscyllium punctatum]|uniref:Uncharacterized protein n=1 Tax=Chiloscyllium punctatum TaxID=137246 RepID=A0A401SC56_CHIPU|nr:hypothetical protein [Chiloscyllium punctatum]